MENRLKLFDFGNFIELFFASYMILFICAGFNVKRLSFSNWLEIIQSIVTIVFFIGLITTPFAFTFKLVKHQKLIANSEEKTE